MITIMSRWTYWVFFCIWRWHYMIYYQYRSLLKRHCILCLFDIYWLSIKHVGYSFVRYLFATTSICSKCGRRLTRECDCSFPSQPKPLRTNRSCPNAVWTKPPTRSLQCRQVYVSANIKNKDKLQTLPGLDQTSLRLRWEDSFKRLKTALVLWFQPAWNKGENVLLT